MVSVIIPTYKRDLHYFSRAINSVVNQICQDIEIIIVDDNATEELLEYRRDVENFINELNSEKIILLQNSENLGSAKTRNRGIEIASGEYITFLDDDDYYLPNKIEEQLSFMVQNNLDMSFSNQILLNQKNVVVDYREYNRLKKNDNKSVLKYHLTRKITGTNTFMVKKDILLKVGGFTGCDMGDEYYLMYDIIKTGCNISYLNKDLVCASRDGQDSLSLDNNRIKQEKIVFDFIKTNFSVLNFFERQYVRFRYNTIKVVHYYRKKKLFKSLFFAFVAFCCSPKAFFVEPIRMKKNIKRINKKINGK